jgi:hypothetical protein
MHFEIIGEIKKAEVIAIGGRIREIMRLQARYGAGHWRKMKGIARVRLITGAVRVAEVHWYEAHGIGRRRFKIKRLLDETA